MAFILGVGGERRGYDRSVEVGSCKGCGRFRWGGWEGVVVGGLGIVTDVTKPHRVRYRMARFMM